MSSIQPLPDRARVRLLSIIGFVANVLILLSPFWLYMHYGAVNYNTPAVDVFWWRTQDLHSFISIGLLILPFLPVLIPLSLFVFLLFLSFRRTFPGNWIGKAEFIFSIISSAIGAHLFGGIGILVFLWGILFDIVNPGGSGFFLVTYGPAFWYPPVGFIISMICAALLQDEVFPKPVKPGREGVAVHPIGYAPRHE